MKKVIFLFTFSVFTMLAFAQGSIESILSEIEKNNMEIQLQRQYWLSQKLQYRTGIQPEDPTLEYDYLAGSPANAGNQHDFTFAQEFDFPTVYVKRDQLADQLAEKSELQFASAKREILLNAKSCCIDIIYHNKLNILLSEMESNTAKMVRDFETMLDSGEGNILDLNKAKLQLIQVRGQLLQNQNELNQLQMQLTAMNGGIVLELNDTTYFERPQLPSTDELITEFENQDLQWKSLNLSKSLSEKELELSKALSLPKWEIGYRYQGILGQTFNGVHTGMSIPLWNNKNLVKLGKSKVLTAEAELAMEKTDFHFHITSLHHKILRMESYLKEFENVSGTLNTSIFLEKSLLLGEITAVEYFTEINFFTNAYLEYLSVEKEYYQSVSELLKQRM